MNVLTLLRCGLVLAVLACCDSLTAYLENILELLLQSGLFEIFLKDVHKRKKILLGVLLILTQCKFLWPIFLESIHTDGPSRLSLQVTKNVIEGMDAFLILAGFGKKGWELFGHEECLDHADDVAFWVMI